MPLSVPYSTPFVPYSATIRTLQCTICTIHYTICTPHYNICILHYLYPTLHYLYICSLQCPSVPYTSVYLGGVQWHFSLLQQCYLAPGRVLIQHSPAIEEPVSVHRSRMSSRPNRKTSKHFNHSIILRAFKPKL